MENVKVPGQDFDHHNTPITKGNICGVDFDHYVTPGAGHGSIDICENCGKQVIWSGHNREYVEYVETSNFVFFIPMGIAILVLFLFIMSHPQW